MNGELQAENQLVKWRELVRTDIWEMGREARDEENMKMVDKNKDMSRKGIRKEPGSYLESGIE